MMRLFHPFTRAAPLMEVHRIRHPEQRRRRFGIIAVLGNHSLDALLVRTLSRYDFSRARACARRVDTQAHSIVGA